MACYTGRTSYFMSGNNKYCVSICQCQRPHPPDPHSHPHSHHPTCQRILPLNQPQINKHGRVQLYRNSTLGWIISFQYSTTKTRDQFLHVYRFGGATNRTGMNFHELPCPKRPSASSKMWCHDSCPVIKPLLLSDTNTLQLLSMAA